ncbi:MAG: hypothetical protein J6N21_22125 [Butyrivibrio sp.]|nr:hypothetical protein [Butyrivibrio sp.]
MMQKVKGFVNRHEAVIISAISAFLILLFTTRSSFLYICNNWDDANSYFSMGKGMMNGLVIYRDLYDQKGPYLYLLYGIAYLISHKSFFGVFIIEVLCATIFLYFAFKTIKARSNSGLAVVIIPLLAAGVYSSWSFYKGGAAEEFCLPLLAYGVYMLDGMLQERIDGPKLKRAIAIAGICAGIIAQVKYTILGFYFSWFIVVMLLCYKKSGIKDAIRMALRFVIFAILPSIPWFIYFLVTGSLDDWYRCYIYNNLFFYSDVSDAGYSLSNRLYELCKVLLFLIEDSFSYFIFIIAGMFLQLFAEKGIFKRLIMPIMFGITFFVIFFAGNKLAYYSIPLTAFAMWGAAYIGSFLAKLFRKRIDDKKNNLLQTIVVPMLFCVIMFASTVFAADNCVSKDYRHMDKDSFWLIKAASYLSEDDTLVNVGGLDAGLYTLTGIVPSCEYFQTNGIGLPIMFEEQSRYLKEGATDYVLAVTEDLEGLGTCYEMVADFYCDEPIYEDHYYLYKRKQQ